MSWDLYRDPLGQIEAATDLSTFIHHFAVMTANGLVLCGDGALPHGVIYNSPKQGDAVLLVPHGVARVRCGGGVPRGADVACNANGQAVVPTTGAAIVGTALMVGLTNSIIPVLLQYRGVAA